MKINYLLSRTSLKKPQISSSKKTDWDVTKWIALTMTILGVNAWTAGAAFNIGYWEIIGWNGPITPLPLQQTALLGFIGAIKEWIYLSLFFIVLGLYLLIFSIRSVTPPKQLRWLSKIQNFLAKRYKLDKDGTRISALLFSGGLGGMSLVVLPLAIWVFAAYSEGKQQSTLELCDAKSVKIFPSTIRLADGTMVSGRFLERSEKLSVLLNNVAINVVTVGEKPQLIDVTNLSALNLKCPTSVKAPK